MASYRKFGEDIRKSVKQDYDGGMSQRRIAEKYGMSKSHVNRILNPIPRAYINTDKHITAPEGFEDAWNDARFRILGIRPGWIKEWNEARQKILKGAQAWATEK